jgi:hypothetical protein
MNVEIIACTRFAIPVSASGKRGARMQRKFAGQPSRYLHGIGYSVDHSFSATSSRWAVADIVRGVEDESIVLHESRETSLLNRLT